MTDAVTGDAVSPRPDVEPDDPATHAEAQSGGEVQASEEDVGVRMGDDPPTAQPAPERGSGD
jgi:hypothetical protein